jgi:hypothetical protein
VHPSRSKNLSPVSFSVSFSGGHDSCLLQRSLS